MEKVLVAIDDKHGAWEPLSHAISLAKRISMQLNILLVGSGRTSDLSPSARDSEREVKRHIDLMKESAQAAGIPVNYFVTEGNFEEEVINFINCNRITLLVIQEVQSENNRPMNRNTASWNTLRHRIACKIDVVAPKKAYP